MNNASLILGLIISTSLLVSSCGDSFEGVSIGNQVWMSENLNLDKFRNGESIPQAKTNKEWIKASEEGQPAWCYYKNEMTNGVKHGKLYNWYAINDPRGLAPTGWHIPNDNEWTTLVNYLGGQSLAGKKMKSKSGWAKNGNGTNESGFSGLPFGIRNIEGVFSNVNKSGYWWSSTESGTNGVAISYSLHDYFDLISRNPSNMAYGMSVRCLRD